MAVCRSPCEVHCCCIADEARARAERRGKQAAAPGVTLALNVTTRSADVLQQRARLQAAAGAPYELASHIGSQGARQVSEARAWQWSQGGVGPT